MNFKKQSRVSQQYNKVDVHSNIADADPHRLVQMLLDGALDKIAVARGYMLRNQIAEKGSHISWAISIIEGLRSSLDKEAGGQIAENLEGLYSYMERRLVEANLNNDPDILIEVSGLLREIREAWVAIRDKVRPASVATENQISAP